MGVNAGMIHASACDADFIVIAIAIGFFIQIFGFLLALNVGC